MPRKKIHLALHPYGVGGPGQHGLWKDPRVASNASIDINYYIRQAQAAEHALFDALFVVDSQFINATYPSHYLNRLEPLTLLSAVATHTRHVGLVGTASSTYNSPYNLARRFASSTTSAAAGPAGTSSPASTPARRATTGSRNTSTTRPATAGPWSSSRSRAACGTRTRTTRSPPTSSGTCSSTRPSCTN